jgi:hypothetical protein
MWQQSAIGTRKKYTEEPFLLQEFYVKHFTVIVTQHT